MNLIFIACSLFKISDTPHILSFHLLGFLKMSKDWRGQGSLSSNKCGAEEAVSWEKGRNNDISQA